MHCDNSNADQLLDWFMPRVEMMSMADEEYEAVLAALESLRDVRPRLQACAYTSVSRWFKVVQCVGPAVLIRYPSVFRGHEKLLTKEAEALMQRPEQFLDTDDDDLDFNLFNATSINLVQLFQVGGSALVQYIPHFFTLIEPYFVRALVALRASGISPPPERIPEYGLPFGFARHHCRAVA